jgi:hypothetical protein
MQDCPMGIEMIALLNRNDKPQKMRGLQMISLDVVILVSDAENVGNLAMMWSNRPDSLA